MNVEHTHLLTTKLKPAVSLTSSIHRPRLLALMDAAELPKVVLVTAPAGYGKSTLLAQWHASVSDRSGWLSLDRSDQDSIGFLRYVVAALNRNGPVISDATESFIASRTTLAIDAMTARIANDLAKHEGDCLLFLDDYHLVESDVIDELMTLLIAQSPDNFHIVIASRTQPRWHVARLRMHGALLEVDAGDMRFSNAETQTLMHDARKISISPGEIGILNQRVEGWAAGLQLASLYLRSRKDLKRSIEDLSGSARDIQDYLSSDVLHRLPGTLRDFLVATSVLERMNGSLCNALLERTDGQARLEEAETLGLFLFPLDTIRGWYRYHHLFREFLLNQLQRERPGLMPVLLQRASAWFAKEGLAEEAVNMALEAGDFERAAQLVEATAMQMVDIGDLPQLNRWLTRFPASIIDSRRRFAAYHCWALIHMGRCRQAEEMLRRADSAIEHMGAAADTAGQDERERLKAELLTLRAIAAIMADDVDRAYEMTSANSFPERPEFAFFSGSVRNVLGLSALARGEFALAESTSRTAQRHHLAAGCIYGAVYSQSIRALSLLARGELHAAEIEIDAADHRASALTVGRRLFCAALPRVLKAALLYERNRLDDACELLEENLPLVEECAHIDIRTAGFLTMARILSARGQEGLALACLDQALSVSSECRMERTGALVAHEGARVRLVAGNSATADQLPSSSTTDAPVDVPAVWTHERVFPALVRCRQLVAQGHEAQAVAPLALLAELATRSTRFPATLQIRTLLATAQKACGRHADAVAELETVLRLGSTQGHVRSIVDEGPVAASLFLDLKNRPGARTHWSNEMSTHLDRLCAAFLEDATRRPPVSMASQITVKATGSPASMGTGDLTDQELRVLQLLSTGASNGQIAAALRVSINTARWHVANILGKLQVSNRTQAASAARSIGLLS